MNLDQVIENYHIEMGMVLLLYQRLRIRLLNSIEFQIAYRLGLYYRIEIYSYSSYKAQFDK